MHEGQQVPTREHVGRHTEPVTGDPALQVDREEAVVLAGENTNSECGPTLAPITDLRSPSRSH